MGTIGVDKVELPTAGVVTEANPFDERIFAVLTFPGPTPGIEPLNPVSTIAAGVSTINLVKVVSSDSSTKEQNPPSEAGPAGTVTVLKICVPGAACAGRCYRRSGSVQSLHAHHQFSPAGTSRPPQSAAVWLTPGKAAAKNAQSAIHAALAPADERAKPANTPFRLGTRFALSETVIIGEQ